jgi:hypothetical protein
VEQISGGFLGANWQVQFLSRSNWLYVLERTIDLAIWTEASTATAGDGATLMLSVAYPAAGPAFFRVRANRP